MTLRTKLVLTFLVAFIGALAIFQEAKAWDHTVIMFPPAGATFTVPLVPDARNCIYVTDCTEHIQPPVEPPTTGNLLKVDFNSVPLGLYSKARLRSDFNVGDTYNDTVHGPDWWSMKITEDPAGNTGRGRVLQVARRAGLQEWNSNSATSISNLPNNKGFRFRADFTAQTEVYLYYETFVPSAAVGGYDWYYPLQHKMLGLINGTLAEAGHETGEDPTPGGAGYNAREQMHGGTWKPDGATALLGITATAFNLYSYWVKKESSADDPTLLYSKSVKNSDMWQHPRGRWIGREVRVKLNTTDSAEDGEYEVKIYDPVGGYNGTVVRSDTDIQWTDDVSAYKWDGIYMYSLVGGNPSDSRNLFPQDQEMYYDNIIVSTSSIL